MFGTYTVEGGRLTFRPRFAPAPGISLRAVLRLPGGRTVEREFRAAAPDLAPAAAVERVYPSTNALPSNQLKFYICFSAPMRKGEAWQRLHLLDREGKPVELPFLEIDEELWDREQRRLTVLFDPGRIKRGVLPLEEVGPAIVEGGRYTLVVDREWRDARGAPLRQGHRKEFHVGPPDRAAVEPASWKMGVPKAGTRDPLVLYFPKAMDYALALRLIAVAGVEGDADLGENETRWQFVPREPWRPAEHRIVVNSALEDLAGNKVGRPFDVDTFDPISKKLAAKTVELKFRPGDR
jgi:hypothetical protein